MKLLTILLTISIGINCLQAWSINQGKISIKRMKSRLEIEEKKILSIAKVSFDCAETLQKFQTKLLKQKVISGNYGQMIAAQEREKIRRHGCQVKEKL